MRYDARVWLRDPAEAGHEWKLLPYAFTCSTSPRNETLTVTIPKADWGSLPDVAEFRLTVWRESDSEWVEPPNARFVGYQDEENLVDVGDVVDWTAVGLWEYHAAATRLADSNAVDVTGGSTPTLSTLANLGKAGESWLSKASHGLHVNDQVMIVETGNNRTYRKGARYYVVEVSGDKFKLSGRRGGSPKPHDGRVGGLKIKEVADTIQKPSHGLERGDLVRVTDNGGGKLETDRDYYVTRAGSDWFQLARQPGGRAVTVGSGLSGIAVSRKVNNRRKFVDLTPGRLLRISIDEARDRGALVGLDVDFDGSKDSRGDDWTYSDRWPVQLGATTSELMDLVESIGLGWFQTQGRTLRFFDGEYGAKRQEDDGSPVRLHGATDSRRTRSREALRTHATVYGEGRVQATAAGPGAGTWPYGRLETFEATSSKSWSWVSRRAERLAAAGAAPLVERVVTMRPQYEGNGSPVSPRPGVDFGVRDLVETWDEDSREWVESRVAEIQYRRDDEGILEADVVLGNRRVFSTQRATRAISRLDWRREVSRAARDEKRAKRARAKRKEDDA